MPIAQSHYDVVYAHAYRLERDRKDTAGGDDRCVSLYWEYSRLLLNKQAYVSTSLTYHAAEAGRKPPTA